MRPALLASVCAIAAACSAFSPGAPTPTEAPRLTAFVIPTRSPTPSVSPTAFTGHYGVLVPTSAGLEVRRENDTTPLGTIDLGVGSVSPDGKIFAGWTRAAPYELRIVDVTRPSIRALVVTLPDEERGFDVIWSLDGTGLLYSVASGGSATTVPTWGALRSVDVLAPRPKELVRYDATYLRPVVWDRIGGDLVTALVVKPGAARGYVVIKGTQSAEQRQFPPIDWQEKPAVSGDGRWVVIAAKSEPTLRTFQVADPGFVIEYHGSANGTSALGRPASTQNATIVDGQLLLWDPENSSRRRVGTSSDLIAIRFFRFDGSAAAVLTSSGLQLIDMATGAITPLTGDAQYGVRLP